MRLSLIIVTSGLLAACGGATTQSDPNDNVGTRTGGNNQGGLAGTASLGGSGTVGVGVGTGTVGDPTNGTGPDPADAGDVYTPRYEYEEGPREGGVCGNSGRAPTYTRPGCGPEVAAACVTPDYDAIARVYCSCRGITVVDGNGGLSERWAHEGPCQEAATDAPNDVHTDDVHTGDVGEGWQWNVNCPQSIDSLCADGGAGIACVRPWSEASKPSTWCERAGASEVSLFGYCKGYYVVSVFGADPVHRDAGIYYYYDVATGNLVHVDSNGIPSLTQCVAGVTGSRFDVFGCNYGSFGCE